ncbi:MAG: response regulator transcription factor [Nitrospirota bacterium]
MSDKIKILLVDDHRLVREGFRKLLETEASFEVVGETDNGRTAVKMTKEILPTVVLMDLSMPYMNGIEAIRQIRAEAPDTKILVLSMHSSRRFVTDSLGAGASGYLLKDAAARELIEAVLAVANDKVYLCTAVAGVIVEDYYKQSSGPQAAAQELLSSREHQVLKLIAEGKSTKEIAFVLNLSAKTVEAHRAQLMKKLGLHTVADLVKYAIREGITSYE